jgi:hypothetical protein
MIVDSLVYSKESWGFRSCFPVMKLKSWFNIVGHPRSSWSVSYFPELDGLFSLRSLRMEANRVMKKREFVYLSVGNSEIEVDPWLSFHLVYYSYSDRISLDMAVDWIIIDCSHRASAFGTSRVKTNIDRPNGFELKWHLRVQFSKTGCTSKLIQWLTKRYDRDVKNETYSVTHILR